MMLRFQFIKGDFQGWNCYFNVTCCDFFFVILSLGSNSQSESPSFEMKGRYEGISDKHFDFQSENYISKRQHFEVKNSINVERKHNKNKIML